jgi:hypothetical protein
VTSLLLALRLLAATSSATAESACSGAWEPGTDGWESCVCTLETWRGMAQGWVDRDESAPYVAVPLGLPSTTRTYGGCE